MKNPNKNITLFFSSTLTYSDLNKRTTKQFLEKIDFSKELSYKEAKNALAFSWK